MLPTGMPHSLSNWQVIKVQVGGNILGNKNLPTNHHQRMLLASSE
jgi:hypothetical protein